VDITNKREITKKIVKATIYRFNKTFDKKPRYQSYHIPLIEGMTVLDVLDYIYENYDSNLAYYSHAACRQGICGYCNLIINGKPSLACQTLVQGDITVKPLQKLQIIRDLVYTRLRTK
jgi:succinate dehydrogenase/fumarate reductase iron-sulfur protein